MSRATDFQLMPFREAFEVWLELHKEEIQERTLADYRFYGRNLMPHFGSLLLSQIHIGHIIEYRKQRATGTDQRRPVGAEIINHEICTLKQIMKMAGLWDLVARFYKPMRKPKWRPPRVLDAETEEKFFRVVSTKPQWCVATCAAGLTSNTSGLGKELRFIQLRHVFLDHIPPKIHIPDDKVKNQFRARVIPLNELALKYVTILKNRAEKLGACKPDHYLFPFCTKKGEYDVNRPASPWFIRSAFRSMRKVLGEGYEWVTPRTFRYQFFTKMFEAGTPDQTIIEIGGHSAIKMSREYSSIRMSAKEEALNKIVPQSVGKSKGAARA